MRNYSTPHFNSHDMHGFIEGSKVIEIDDKSKQQLTVHAISGFLKSDYLQFADNGAWHFAKNYKNYN